MVKIVSELLDNVLKLCDKECCRVCTHSVADGNCDAYDAHYEQHPGVGPYKCCYDGDCNDCTKCNQFNPDIVIYI